MQVLTALSSGTGSPPERGVSDNSVGVARSTEEGGCAPFPEVRKSPATSERGAVTERSHLH